MSVDQAGLNVTLTAEDAGASAVFQQALTNLVDIDAALLELVQSGGAASGGIAKVGEASATSSKFLTDLNVAGGSAARTFSALGVEAGAAAGRVEALTGVIGELGALAPEIIAIGIAIAGVGSAFSFFKEGIQSATEMQHAMSQLRAVVEESGQSWADMQPKIDQFLSTESMASGFTRSQLMPALQDLAARFGDVNTAMEVLRITEEVARGTGMDLATAERELTDILGGRVTTLARLDPKLKEMIKDHASERDILMELHAHYSRAVQDSNDLATATGRAKAAQEEASEMLGNLMLPMLASLETAIVGAWKNTEAFGQDWAIIWQGIALTVKGAIDSIKDDLAGMARAYVDVMGGNFGAVLGDLSTGGDRGRSEMQTGESIVKSATIALDQRPTAGDLGASTVTQAIASHNQGVLDAGALPDTPVGNLKSGRSGSGKSKGAGGVAGFDFQNLPDQIKPATDALKAFDDEVAHLPHTVAGYTQAITELRGAINQETYQHTELEGKLHAAATAYEDARAKANAFGNELKSGAVPATAANKERLKDLEEAVRSAKARYDELTHAISQNSSELKKHQDELSKDETALSNLQNGFQKFVNDSKSNMEQDLALSQMTNAQKVAYYQQMVDSIDVIDQESLKKKEQYYTQELSAYKALLQEEQKERDAQQKQIENIESTFLNDLLEKHKSFHDAFKTVWDDIVKIFIQDIEKMIMESALFKNVFGNLGVGVGGGAPGGILSGLLSVGSSSGGSGGANASNPYVELGQQSISAITGSPGGVAVGSLTYNANTQSDINTILGGVDNGSGGAGGFIPAGGGSALSSIAGGALMGVAIGGAVGGGNVWSQVLGGIGGAAGEYFGGPIGAAVGSTVGGFIGGLFGPHPNAQNNPDMFSPGTWGQDNANLWGAGVGSNANNFMNVAGQAPFSMDPTLAAQTGNMGLLQYIAQWEQQNPSLVSSTLGSLAPIFAGENVATPIPNGKNGMLDLANGQQLYYSTLYQDAITALNDIMATGTGGPKSPVFTLTHLYPNANLTSSNAPGVPQPYPGNSGNEMPGLHSPGSGGTFSQTMSQQPYIHVDLSNATIVGPGGLEEVASEIATILGRLNAGQIPGGYNHAMQSRFQGF